MNDFNKAYYVLILFILFTTNIWKLFLSKIFFISCDEINSSSWRIMTVS